MTQRVDPAETGRRGKHHAKSGFGLKGGLYLLALAAAVGLAVAPPERFDLRLLLYVPAFLLYLGFVIFFRVYRQWLLYYVVGAFGLTLMLVFFAQSAGVEASLIRTEVGQVVSAANLLGVPVKALSDNQFVLREENGWSILEMGVECSAVLEISTLIALILFYPAFTLGWKIKALALGLAATYAINLGRMLIILGVADNFGPSSIFVGHAIIGRLFFFSLVIALYWFIITWPTVKQVGAGLGERPA